MKIQKVKIDHFKILKDIEVDVNGQHLLIVGENSLGKSTFIQFLEIAIGKNTNIPINTTGKGEVVVNKDGEEYTFRVKIKDGKSVIEVTAPDGMKDTRKGTIAGIVGAVDFDIEEFVEMSKTESGRKKQVEIFKSFLPTEIKSELLRFEAHVKANFEERAFVNKQIKELSGAVKSNPLYGVPFSGKLIDISKLTSDLDSVSINNSKVKDVATRYEMRAESINKLSAEILELQQKLVSLQEQKSGEEMRQAEAKKWLDKNKEQPVADIQSQIDIASKNNDSYRSHTALKEQMDRLAKYEDEAGDLTVKIESGRQAIADTIRQMDSPINGLEFDNETLIYNGLPVSPDTLSTSEIMVLGAKMKMAENPEVGILFLQKTECIGNARWKEILDMCKAEDWELIGEKVERGQEKLTFELFVD